MISLSLLVISNNKFSTVRNNGKTLASFFENCELSNIYQLSLHDDDFDVDIGSHALTITPTGLRIDSDAHDINLTDDLLSRTVKQKHMQRPVVDRRGNCVGKKISNLMFNIFSNIKKRNFFNLICRDVIYLISFIVSFFQVVSFIKKNKIKEIFFVYPDFLFFQYFVICLAKVTGIKLTIYFTDDYLLDFKPSDSSIKPRGGYASLLNANVKNLVKESYRIFVISQKMSDAYFEMYGFKSQVLINSTSLSLNSAEVKNYSLVNSKILHISYFGSLHSGRNDSLIKFSNLVVKYASCTGFDVVINVYTPDKPNFLTCEYPYLIHFHQPCIGESYFKKIEDSDYLLFLEGFNEEDIKSTWLSCSTKIPEYLSSKKPIIAFGSPGNGSMDLLIRNGLGFFLNDDDIDSSFDDADSPFNEELAFRVTGIAFKYYEKNFSKEIMMQRLSYECLYK